jgi:hypothetical protein
MSPTFTPEERHICIEKLAHLTWIHNGCHPGNDLHYWLQAEREFESLNERDVSGRWCGRIPVLALQLKSLRQTREAEKEK